MAAYMHCVCVCMCSHKWHVCRFTYQIELLMCWNAQIMAPFCWQTLFIFQLAAAAANYHRVWSTLSLWEASPVCCLCWYLLRGWLSRVRDRMTVTRRSTTKLKALGGNFLYFVGKRTLCFHSLLHFKVLSGSKNRVVTIDLNKPSKLAPVIKLAPVLGSFRSCVHILLQHQSARAFLFI